MYIADDNGFVTSVCEYRLTDLKGKFCSNVYTSFEGGSFTSDMCQTSLFNVVDLAMKCLRCLMNGDKCVYETLDARCGKCEVHGHHCVSIAVFHVLWDMAPAHKKTCCVCTKTDLLSDESDYKKSKMFTIGFGGLHLAKSPVNILRNHVMTYDGENFGVNILRSYKHESSLLSTIKNAVFVGSTVQELPEYLSQFLDIQKMPKLKRLLYFNICCC